MVISRGFCGKNTKHAAPIQDLHYLCCFSDRSLSSFLSDREKDPENFHTEEENFYTEEENGQKRETTKEKIHQSSGDGGY
ncbi:MAG: hypothetical protein II333_03250 [Clostridia bacterium]|nr:hypothetical protein [Clostridia bacterium]